jgi:hypothetical protein
MGFLPFFAMQNLVSDQGGFFGGLKPDAKSFSAIFLLHSQQVQEVG